MRMETKSIKDAERLSRLFEECHIESKGNKVYLVVDKVKKRTKAIA